MHAALDTLAALGHESRLRAFRRLVEAGPQGLPVGMLREQLGIPPATLSAHLNVLRRAALVTDQREGRVIRVRANYLHMQALIAYLTENCCAVPETCSAEKPTCPPRSKGTRR